VYKKIESPLYIVIDSAGQRCHSVDTTSLLCSNIQG